MAEITITLAQIRDHGPCKTGWKKLTKSLEGIQKFGKNTPFPLSHIIDSNNLTDALWCLRCLPEHNNLWRKYAVWCARQVQHLLTDERSIDALDVAWRHSNGQAADNELAAAWAAARAAARVAARVAARAAAWDAAGAAAWDAACAAAGAAARAAAGDAARAAARAAAGDAAWDAAGAAARAAQSDKLRKILAAGEWVE